MCNFNISIDFLSDVWYDTYVVVYCVEAVIILIRKIFALSLAFILLFGTFLNVNAAKKSLEDRLIDSFVLGNPHDSIFGAIYGTAKIDNPRALGILETYSVAAAIVAASGISAIIISAVST